MKRKRSRLGAPTKQHAGSVRRMVSVVESHTKLARTGSCHLRLTSLTAALGEMGQVWAHAFQSGGRIAKGALSPKTVTTDEANRVYDAEMAVSEAVTHFRFDCVKAK